MSDLRIDGPGVAPHLAEPGKAGPAPERSFGETLKVALESVAEDQSRAAKTAAGFMVNDGTDLHTVMLEMEKADLSFKMMMEVRNKLLEAYRQIMSMPM